MLGQFLIYGSYGYTGKLIVQEALRRGLVPVLAGRDVDKIGRQAAALGLEWRSFPLSNTAALDHALQDTRLVLLAAGPFINTSMPVVEACLRTGAHYLDITGEINVYRHLYTRDEDAKNKGVMLATGMGFDVVPSDCLANHLANLLPTASELKLAFTFQGVTRWTRGTLRSGLGQIKQGLLLRRKGKLVRQTGGEKSIVVDFGDGPRSCGQYTWGDVVTAYYSTRIPNIEVYFTAAPSMRRLTRWLSTMQRLIGWKLTRRLVGMAINLLPNGASPEQRSRTQSIFWGQVTDASGQRRSSRLQTSEPYDFTALSAIRAVEKILAGDYKPGFQTPAMAFGSDFVLEIEGVNREDLVIR
jgi:short subunit dehydrogenase-like uncharacterized protein